MTRFLTLAALVIAGYWTFLFIIQRSLAFPAPSLAAAPPRPADARLVWLESPAGRTEAWYLPALSPPTRPAPLLLFAHGNAELINDWPAEFTEPRTWGLAVLLVEYPGYGQSGGAPSSRTIQAAFEAAFDWAASQPELDARRILLYGRSLGGGAVAALSTSRPAAALVLESTFTNTTAFAAGLGAPRFLVRDRFDNLRAVSTFRGPRLILHGDHDEVVPTKHGRQLAAAGGVRLHLMPCGHNDCPRPWVVLRSFLQEAGLLPGPAVGTI